MSKYTERYSGLSNSQQVNEALRDASQTIRSVINTTLDGLQKDVASKTFRAANQLRNAAMFVLRGQRSGRVYKVPDTYGGSATKITKKLMKDYGHKLRGGVLYQASAPGEPPAVRTGIFRNSWGVRTHVEKSGNVFKGVSSIESSVKTDKGALLGEILEKGTKKMAPRPYKDLVIHRAMPKIRQIYKV